MGRLAKLNVGLAAATAAVLLLATSPILDPKRISVASQMERLRSGKVTAAAFDYDYLRFNLGRHGMNALNELKSGSDKEVASLAGAALARTGRYTRQSATPEQIASRIRLHPDKAVLDPAFVEYLKGAVAQRSWEHPSCLIGVGSPCDMFQLDLNGDGEPEIVTFVGFPQVVYSRGGGTWKKVGNLIGGGGKRPNADAPTDESQIKVVPAAWPDLVVGETRYTVQRIPAPQDNP
jgi:hypothetical protein